MGHGILRHFNIDFCGKQKITSCRCRCSYCGRTAFSSSYVAGKFLCLGRFPLIPLGRVCISNECAACGHRGVTGLRKYGKLHSKDLADMIKAFSSDPDNPQTVLQGLHTLMVYNEEQWFMDVVDQYGRRFYDHAQLQLTIAEGLFRFGRYDEAQTYCRKAVVLGAGKVAEDLLSQCQILQEKDDEPPLSPESMWRPYKFIFAVTAGLLITFVVAGISASRNYEAWLINGSPVYYSIEINGRHHRLKPYEQKKILLSTGKHAMRITDLNGFEKTVPFVYQNSLLHQKFMQKALVLNPDAMALLAEEVMQEGEVTNRYLHGEMVYVLTGIDYLFSDFPKRKGSEAAAHSRIYHVVPSNTVQMVRLLRAHGGPGDAAEYARHALRADPELPDTKELLKAAIRDLSTDEAVEFLQFGRAVQPPLLIWHLFYQDMMKAQRPGHDLQEEYGLLFKEHPNVPEYLYLLGRVIRNRNTAKLYLERFEQSPIGNGTGYFTIAQDLLFSGRFQEAESYILRALEKAPDDEDFRSIAKQIHLALRQYEVPLKYVEEQLEANPERGERIAEKIKYLTLLGEHQTAVDTINNASTVGEEWLFYFHAARFYVSGNVSDYLENLRASGMGNVQLEASLHAGEVAAAHELLTSDDVHDYRLRLILFCAASHYGGEEIAAMALAGAVAELEKGMLQQKEIKAMLVGDAPPDIRSLLELRILPQEKSILCAALGFRFPEHQATCFGLSRKFNIIPEFPHLLLKKWTR